MVDDRGQMSADGKIFSFGQRPTLLLSRPGYADHSEKGKIWRLDTIIICKLSCRFKTWFS